MVDIKLVRHSENLDELTDLFQASFNHSISLELWNWKYIQNPVAPTYPEVVVAIENGKIIGARPYLLGEMWFGSERFMTAEHCDTMVHPDHQKKGLFGKLERYAIENLKQRGAGLSYGFPNALSRQGFLKQGYRIVTQTENLFRIVRPKKVASQILGCRFAGSGLGLVYDIFLNTQPKKTSTTQNNYHVEISDQFTETFKEIDALRDKTGIDLVRSESYLRWRFDLHPVNIYKYIAITRNSEIIGYAVVSVQEYKNLIFGTIVDYLVKDDDISYFNIIVRQCLNLLEKSECDVIMISAISQPKLRTELVKHLGFRSSAKFPYNRYFQYGHVDVILLNEQLSQRIDVYDKNNWHITDAYRDTS
ncbi:MAG: GNAT family N-acetyltransferase [Planctomycetes bacterium]|nr:GNAT family N-acetyltransferase [Planctomycetota bacterium]